MSASKPKPRNLAEQLWKKERDRKEDRYNIYKDMLDTLINQIFYEKDLSTHKQYLEYSVPQSPFSKGEADYYDAKECALYIEERLFSEGFYSKTMDNYKSVYVSWSQEDLERVKRKKDKIYKEKVKQNEIEQKRLRKLHAAQELLRQKSEARLLQHAPYIELDGDQNILENRIKLTNFLLQNKAKKSC